MIGLKKINIFEILWLDISGAFIILLMSQSLIERWVVFAASVILICLLVSKCIGFREDEVSYTPLPK